MKKFTQPNGAKPIKVASFRALSQVDPSQYMSGTLFQIPSGHLWRVSGRYFVRLTRQDGTLKPGAKRWAVEA